MHTDLSDEHAQVQCVRMIECLLKNNGAYTKLIGFNLSKAGTFRQVFQLPRLREVFELLERLGAAHVRFSIELKSAPNPQSRAIMALLRSDGSL